MVVTAKQSSQLQPTSITLAGYLIDLIVRKGETSRLLELVGLPADFADRFPQLPADSCSVSASPARWPASRRSFCLMKQSPSLDAHTQVQVMDLLRELKKIALA